MDDSTSAAAPNHLFVVIPGIGGSVLQDRHGKDVWGCGIAGSAQTLLNPERLHIDEPLTPVDLLRDRRVLGKMLIPGYYGQVRRLCNALNIQADSGIDVAIDGRPPKTSAPMMLFPYDFRQPMAANAERLASHVNQRVDGTSRQVVVIAHSMGGLIARYWWSCCEGWRVCHALYTLGTPHRGAPKALDWLGNGAPTPVLGRRLSDATAVLQSWPSVYELLPRYPMVFDRQTWLSPHELPAAAVDQGFNRSHAQRAYCTHLELERAGVEAYQQMRTSFLFRSVRSGAHPTTAYGWLSNGTLQVGQHLPQDVKPWHAALTTWGDGTVPEVSTLPNEFDAPNAPNSEAFLADTVERHKLIIESPALLKPMARLATGGTAAIRGDGDSPELTLGLDLEDCVAQGEEFHIRVVVRGTNPGRVSRMRASLSASSQSPVEMTSQSNEWIATLDCPEPGIHTISIDATVVESRQPALTVQDSLAVLPTTEN